MILDKVAMRDREPQLLCALIKIMNHVKTFIPLICIILPLCKLRGVGPDISHRQSQTYLSMSSNENIIFLNMRYWIKKKKWRDSVKFNVPWRQWSVLTNRTLTSIETREAPGSIKFHSKEDIRGWGSYELQISDNGLQKYLVSPIE